MRISSIWVLVILLPSAPGLVQSLEYYLVGKMNLCGIMEFIMLNLEMLKAENLKNMNLIRQEIFYGSLYNCKLMNILVKH